MIRKSLLSIFCFVALCSFAFAKDLEVTGKLSSVDKSGSKFVITTIEGDSITFLTSPITKYEWKNRMIEKASFSDLKPGLWVEVEYEQGKSNFIAKEVELHEVQK